MRILLAAGAGLLAAPVIPARRLFHLLAPWVLVPAALYAGALYAGRLGAPPGPVAWFGVRVVLTLGVPALALLCVERRLGPRAARTSLVALTVGAAVWIAAGAAVLSALVVALLMQVAAYGYGGLLAGRLRLEDLARGWRGAPMLITVGWAILIVIGLAGGALGILTRPTVASAVAIGIAAAVLRRGSWSAPVGGDPAQADALTERGTGSSPERGSPHPVWWWGFVSLLLIGLVGAVAPEVRHDALTAHLPIAREFAARRGIVEMRSNTASYFQLNADLLYALGMVLRPGDTVPKLLHTFAGAWASLLVYEIGARRWNPATGLAAAAVVAGTPLVWWAGGSAYTDLWVMLFAVGLLVAVDRYARRPGGTPALVAGLLAGAAVGVKITGVIAVLPLLIVFAAAALRRSPHRGRDVLVMLSAAALAGAFWYGRAWWLTGNPVYPLLGGLSRGDFARMGGGSTAAAFGMGTAPWDLFLLPWRTARYPEAFLEEGTIGVAYLALAPAALLAVARGVIPRWMVATAAGATVIWIATAQYVRYFLPGLPLWALIGAAGLFARGSPTPRPAAAGGVLALVLALGAGTWALPGAPNVPWELVRGWTTRTAYLERMLPGFAVADHARRSLPPSARIYGAGEDMAFYYERFFVSMSWYGRVFRRGLAGAVLEARTGGEVAAILRQAGFTHLVVNPEHDIIATWRRPDAWLGRERFWEDGLRVEFARGGYYLFDLRP